MKRNIVAALLGSLALLAVPSSAWGDTLSDCERQMAPSGQTEEPDFILQAVKNAMEQETPDLESQEMKGFLVASAAWDELSREEQGKLPDGLEEDIRTVRRRIGEAVCSQGGIVPVCDKGREEYIEKNWYVKMEVAEGNRKGEILEKVKKKYEGSSPELISDEEIRYTDIRSGSPHRHWEYMSLRFPIPKGYDSLENPRVLSLMDGELADLQPERQGDCFYVDGAMDLDNILVVNLPIALTGLSLEPEARVNQGQKLTLKALPLPAGATEKYSLKWNSSDQSVAEVSPEGVVTGKSPGSCRITASVPGKSGVEASCQVTVVQGVHSLPVTIAQALEATRSYMLSADTDPAPGSEWFVVGLARGGLDPGDSYFQKYYNHFANYLEEKKGALTNSSKYTEYSKAIIAMTAMGKDARDVGGYNLFLPLADMENVKAQGVNGPIWALMALNSSPSYIIPQVSGVKVQTTEEGLIQYLLENRTKKGGWSMDGQSPDPDITAMALQAFASYYRKPGYEQVTAAVDEGLELLSRMQNAAGGYSSMGAENVESCVQVITALCMLGIDPGEDMRFVKGGFWTMEHLLTYRLENGAFMHVKTGSGNGGAAAGAADGMATEQAYYALVAYQRLKEGKTGLYDMSDIELAKGGAGDGSGTGLEPPSSPSPSETPALSGMPTPSGTPVPSGTRPTETVNLLAQSQITASPSPRILPGRGVGTGTVSGNGNTGTSGGASPTPEASRKTASAGKKSSDPENELWDGELEGYTETDTGENWDIDGAEIPVEEIPLESGKDQAGGIPPFAAGFAGGLCGAGALKGAKILYKKKKRRK